MDVRRLCGMPANTCFGILDSKQLLCRVHDPLDNIPACRRLLDQLHKSAAQSTELQDAAATFGPVVMHFHRGEKSGCL
jgi:hypothetical protein